MSNDSIKNIINNKILMIIEKPLKYIGRAGNLAWLGFGEYVTTINHKGIQRKIAQYTLHIQCPFRITQTEEKIICAGDMYEPNSSTEYSESFDWDKQGANLYDENARKLNCKLEKGDIVVTGINSNNMGDLRIFLSSKFEIEVFTNTSADVEEWRFFESGTEKEHFVITGKGIE